MFNIIPTDLYTKTGQWLSVGLCFDNLRRNRINFFVFKNSQSIFYDIRADFPLYRKCFFFNSNWISIYEIIKHFQFIQNPMNKS